MPREAEKSSMLRNWMHERFRAPSLAVEGLLRKAADKAPKREYLVWGLSLGLACLFLWSAFFGPQGVVELRRLRGALAQLEEENEVLLLQNQALEKEVYLLRNDEAHLEKVAREEYGYVRDGEKVYTVPDPDPAAGTRTEEGGIRKGGAGSP
jgi:cell division protein FtsB